MLEFLPFVVRSYAQASPSWQYTQRHVSASSLPSMEKLTPMPLSLYSPSEIVSKPKRKESPAGKLLISGTVAWTFELFGGHYLEFVKIAKQTVCSPLPLSPPWLLFPFLVSSLCCIVIIGSPSLSPVCLQCPSNIALLFFPLFSLFSYFPPPFLTAPSLYNFLSPRVVFFSALTLVTHSSDSTMSLHTSTVHPLVCPAHEEDG